MIADMKKLVLVGYNDEKGDMLKLISRLKIVEVCKTSELDDTAVVSVQHKIDDIVSRLARINFAFGFIDQKRNDVKTLIKAKACDKKALPKRPIALITPSKTVMGFDEFDKACERYPELDKIIKELESFNDEILECKNSITRLKNQNEQLSVYSGLDIPFDKFKSTDTTTVKLGLVPVVNMTQLEEVFNIYPLTYLVKFHQSLKNYAVAVIYHNDCKAETENKLSELEFSESLFDYDKTASQIIKDNDDKIAELKKRIDDIALSVVKYDEYLPLLKLLSDYYNLELKKAEADSGIRETSKAYVLEGWIPAAFTEFFDSKLEKSNLLYDVSYRDPKEDEIPPTWCVNNGLVSKYETVTNMYTAPKYKEVDPNPFVTVFFFIIFGMMMSDAGYGLIMALASAIVLKLSKPKDGDGKLIFIILMGGISTIAWGIVFGGYFGLTFHPLWFAPLDEPVSMLILSLALGIIHIITGMGINAYVAFKNKDYIEAVFGILSWYVLFLGIGLFALTLLFDNFALKISSYVLLALGAVMVFLGGALGKGKSFLKRIMGGLKKYYDIIGYFSDILSYCRIFGLGLATGAIAMVVNTIAEIIIGMFPQNLAFIGVIISIPILVLFHLFNIAINVLGAYIHNCRLQYIEFFSRFFTGGGRLFYPLGTRTKYISFAPEDTEERKNIKVKNRKDKNNSLSEQNISAVS